MDYKRPKGTRDHFDLASMVIDKITGIFVDIAKRYGYKQMIIPTFELADLYQRQMPTADVVVKELYEFFDKKQRHLALRPEFTAGVVRAIIENKWYPQTPLRVYYFGNVFRYERPQANRYREFIQFGCELFGENSAISDVEIIQICWDGLKALGIDNFTLSINNIGNEVSRKKWIDALREYFQNYTNQLTPLSCERIKLNPLRILDDKVDGVKDFVKNAPQIANFLSDQEVDEFNKIKTLLTELNIPFKVEPTLVRGLDYYTNFVFEFIKNDGKSQDTLIAGGRYNNLVNEIGQVDLPAVGFSVGVDRLVNEYVLNDRNLNQIQLENKLDIVVGLSKWNQQADSLVRLANWLRQNHLKVLVSSSSEFKKNINMTIRMGANYYLESGKDNDLAKNKYQVYDVVNKRKTVPLDQQTLLQFLHGELTDNGDKIWEQ